MDTADPPKDTAPPPQKDRCFHIDQTDILIDSKLQNLAYMQALKKQVFCCQYCQSVSNTSSECKSSEFNNKIWLCLSPGCLFVGCQFRNQTHHVQHYIDSAMKHTLFINPFTFMIICINCEQELLNHQHHQIPLIRQIFNQNVLYSLLCLRNSRSQPPKARPA